MADSMKPRNKFDRYLESLSKKEAKMLNRIVQDDKLWEGCRILSHIRSDLLISARDKLWLKANVDSTGGIE